MQTATVAPHSMMRSAPSAPNPLPPLPPKQGVPVSAPGKHKANARQEIPHQPHTPPQPQPQPQQPHIHLPKDKAKNGNDDIVFVAVVGKVATDALDGTSSDSEAEGYGKKERQGQGQGQGQGQMPTGPPKRGRRKQQDASNEGEENGPSRAMRQPSRVRPHDEAPLDHVDVQQRSIKHSHHHRGGVDSHSRYHLHHYHRQRSQVTQGREPGSSQELRVPKATELKSANDPTQPFKYNTQAQILKQITRLRKAQELHRQFQLYHLARSRTLSSLSRASANASWVAAPSSAAPSTKDSNHFPGSTPSRPGESPNPSSAHGLQTKILGHRRAHQLTKETSQAVANQVVVGIAQESTEEDEYDSDSSLSDEHDDDAESASSIDRKRSLQPHLRPFQRDSSIVSPVLQTHADELALRKSQRRTKMFASRRLLSARKERFDERRRRLFAQKALARLKCTLSDCVRGTRVLVEASWEGDSNMCSLHLSGRKCELAAVLKRLHARVDQQGHLQLGKPAGAAGLAK